MTRASRAVSEKTAKVRIGDIDVVSRAAWSARVPLCEQGGCTRAAGHDESFPGHPSTSHVATGLNYVVLEVWE